MATRLHSTDIPNKLSESLNNYNVTFLTAPPAFGKSVLLTDILSLHNRKAIILIPNKTSIVLLHKYTSKLFSNRKIGYRMSNDSSSSHLDDVTLITTGYFLEWITYNKKIMNNPLTLVIDEAHVSDWQTDLVIRIALYYRVVNKNLKVILSSATLNIERFLHMASCSDSEKLITKDSVDIISLTTEKPNVTVKYIKRLLSQIPSLVKEHLLGINTLVICPGEKEINELMTLFEESEDPLLKSVLVKCLYSKLDTDDISDALEIGNQWTILIATNMVESSVTIKNIDAVIDLGVRKLAYLDNKGRMTLKTKKAAKSNIIQALSRCGRGHKTGLGFVLMTQPEYNLLDEFPEPEVYRNPLYNQIFRLIRAELPIYRVFCEDQLNDYLQEDMIMMRSHGIIKISETGYELTPIGKIISKIQLSLLSNKFLLDVIFHEEPDIWYYAVLIATWTDLTDPMFYKPKMKYKETQEEFSKRHTAIRELYQKYKIGVDSFDEILLIVDNIFINDGCLDDKKESIKLQVEINYKQLGNSGLNSKTIRSWKKLINYTITSLQQFGYFVNTTNKYDIKNSDNLRARLSPYLYSSFSDSFHNINTFHSRTSLKLDNNCSYNLITDDNLSHDRSDLGESKNYIFGLGTFSVGNSDIISKIINYHHPIMSDKSRNLLQNNSNIPIDIWENIIFKYLKLEEKLKLMAASRF